MARAKRTKGNPNWTKGGPSPNPSGKARADSRPSTYGESIEHLDGVSNFAGSVHGGGGWLNHVTGLGIPGHDKSVATSFRVEVIESEDAMVLWRGDPVGARIVETVPNEALRQEFELRIGEDDVPDAYKPPEPVPMATASPSQLGIAGAPGSKPGTDPRMIGAPGRPMAAPKALGKSAKRDAAIAFGRRHPGSTTRLVQRAIMRNRADAGDAKPLQVAIEKQLKDLQLVPALKEAMCYERAYGGGAILLGANDFTTDLRVPLDLKKVRSLDYLTPLEGRELIPLFYYNNPRAPKFGQPAIYQLIPYVIGAPIDGYAPRVTQIHESRLLCFSGTRVSKRIMMTGTLGWGDSVFTRVIRALRGFNVGHQSAEILLSDFAQAVYKIRGLADLISRNPNALTDSMLAVDLGRSIARAVVIDAEEDFERQSTTLTGYPETLDRLALNLAAAADMPLTLLMGQSPAGMNATGASDIRFFYDRVASVQTQRVGPAIMRVVDILLATMKQDPNAVPHSVKFKPLWQPTEKEVAESHFTQAQADAIYLDRDVVSPEEMAMSRFGGDTYSYETRIDFEARSDQESVVAPTVEAKPKAGPESLIGGFEYGASPTMGPMPDAAKVAQNSTEGKPGYKIEE